MPEDGADASIQTMHPKYKGALSRTTSGCGGATLARVAAAPILLGRRPPCNPICEACTAIVWSRAGPLRHATVVWATLPVHPATPLLLTHRPACLPVRKAILAIVRIGWPHRHHRHCRRWHNRHHHWRGSCGRATKVVHATTPRLFVRSPGRLGINRAIERVDWPYWARWLRGRRRGRWRGRRRWEWRGWHCRCGFWESCRRPSASPAFTAAAPVLLLHGPQALPIREPCIAVEGK